MTRVLAILFLVSVLVLAVGNSANAQPVDITLYETSDNNPPNGSNDSEMGPPVSLPFLIGVDTAPVTGNSFIVLLESGTDHSTSNWSDVIVITTPALDSATFTEVGFELPGDQYIGAFTDTNLVSTAQLFSDPAFDSISIGQNPTIWMAEGPDGLTTIGPFIVHSDAPGPGDTDVPEPSTLLLLGAGLAGVGLLRRKFKS